MSKPRYPFAFLKLFFSTVVIEFSEVVYVSGVCFSDELILQEELAALNLAKYRKAQKELEEAEERADQAEVAMSRLRAKNRTSVSVTKTPTVSFSTCSLLASSV